MGANFDNLLFLNVTVEALEEFRNLLTSDRNKLLRLLEEIHTPELTINVLNQQDTIQMAENFSQILANRKYCYNTGFCIDPENHWPDLCSPIGKVISLIKNINNGENFEHAAVLALKNKKEEIVQRYRDNTRNLRQSTTEFGKQQGEESKIENGGANNEPQHIRSPTIKENTKIAIEYLDGLEKTEIGNAKAIGGVVREQQDVNGTDIEKNKSDKDEYNIDDCERVIRYWLETSGWSVEAMRRRYRKQQDVNGTDIEKNKSDIVEYDMEDIKRDIYDYLETSVWNVEAYLRLFSKQQDVNATDIEKNKSDIVEYNLEGIERALDYWSQHYGCNVEAMRRMLREQQDVNATDIEKNKSDEDEYNIEDIEMGYQDWLQNSKGQNAKAIGGVVREQQDVNATDIEKNKSDKDESDDDLDDNVSRMDM